MSERNIIVFPNGVDELFLENTLGNIFSEEPDEVLLYFFARCEADLDALSEYETAGCGHMPVVKLCGEEIRREVIEYYEGLAEKMEVNFRVMYEADGELVSEESLGWEKVGA